MGFANAITDPNVARALADPLAVRVLDAVARTPATARQLAERFAVEVCAIGRRLHRLATAGLVEVVDAVPGRRAAERSYRARPGATVVAEAWDQLPSPVRGALVHSAVEQLEASVEAAGPEGFLRDDAHAARVPVWLDDEGWREMSEHLEATLARIDAIVEAAGERDTPKDRRAAAVLALFDRPDGAPAGGDAAGAGPD
jgi:DNA-binding transcriptional ArsR family regulator